MLILVFLAVLTGCAKIKEFNNDAPSGREIGIALFKCNCTTLVQETVQDAFIDEFFTNTNSKPIKGENGYITIQGKISIEEGHTASSSGLLLGSSSGIGGGSSGSAATGAYVTGITIQAYKNGELIATHSIGQNLGSGKLIAPVSLAKKAAKYISTVLVRQNEIGRK